MVITCLGACRKSGTATTAFFVCSIDLGGVGIVTACRRARRKARLVIYCKVQCLVNHLKNERPYGEPVKLAGVELPNDGEGLVGRAACAAAAD
jgi:hypothetical protein